MGYSFFSYPIEACWLDLSSKAPAAAGSIPSYIEDTSKHFLRVFQQESGKARTTFPTNIMRSYISHTDYILSQVGLNLYKETPAAQYEFGNTKLLLTALRTRQAYSSDLRYATNRVGLVTDEGVCYADTHDNLIPKEEYNLFQRENGGQLKCDGLITNISKITLISYSADCVLAKLEDPETGAIGVFHAQWRNLIGKGENSPDCKDNIIEEMIFRMGTELGTKPENIQVILCPCISQQSFKVGPDVAQAFNKAGLRDAILEDDELWEYYIDLQYATIELLKRYGVDKKSINILPYSTDDPWFCSKRLSRTATVKGDFRLLSPGKYQQKTVNISKPIEQKMGPINPQNLLIVKKF